MMTDLSSAAKNGDVQEQNGDGSVELERKDKLSTGNDNKVRPRLIKKSKNQQYIE